MASTASLVPFNTLKTPAGSPASPISSAIFRAERGVCSDGLRIKQLPAVMAMGIIQSGTITGKLNGVIPATTPIGSYNDSQLTPFDTANTSPLRTFVKEVANSITSIPRSMLPFASGKVLPFSRATSSANSS